LEGARPRQAARTSQSQLRLELARELAERVPAELAGEIAVTGSAALGVADARSDLELNLWSEEVPPAEARRAWLAELGTTDVALAVERGPDGTLWETCRYRGVWVEIGWQTLARQERNVAALAGGTVVEHDELAVAGAVVQAVALRSDGRLAAWQRTLATYPDGLAERIISAQVERWGWPHWVALRWAYPERVETLAHAGCLVADLRAALRVLFAVNRRWETGWKWVRPAVLGLQTAPEALLDRIDAVVAERRPEAQVRGYLGIVLDCLALAPDLPEVARARQLIRESLDSERGGRTS
jgi:hypothetical protein